MNQDVLIPHLFRSESSKINAVLCKHFGIDHIETAEDITSETFLAALETWTYNGIPEQPVAWLYTVAKNKARNYFTRRRLYKEKIIPEITFGLPATEEMEIDLSSENISDSQLKMLFAVCHPSIPEESQIALSLRILCGFGIEEIANAFLTNKETINKRLYRAKEKLKAEKVTIVLPPINEISKRLEVVLRTLYLLFNEGYYSESENSVLREELCLEAMRLTNLLIQNEETNLPAVNALFSLMCFHSSRFEARKGANGEIVLYHDQDESLWNHELITRGAFHLKEAASGETLSKYHLEASIAYWHTIKEDTREKWDNILQLFNKLLRLEYSPIAALNRTFALSKVKGKKEAIVEAEKLKLTGNHYYFALLGELYTGIDNTMAREHLQSALSIAKTETDKNTIGKKMDELST